MVKGVSLGQMMTPSDLEGFLGNGCASSGCAWGTGHDGRHWSDPPGRIRDPEWTGAVPTGRGREQRFGVYRRCAPFVVPRHELFVSMENATIEALIQASP